MTRPVPSVHGCRLSYDAAQRILKKASHGHRVGWQLLRAAALRLQAIP